MDNKTILDNVTTTNDDYYYKVIKKAFDTHLKHNADYPINITVGDSPHINLNANSLKHLVQLFDRYHNALYDQYKYEFNIKTNPHIVCTPKPVNNEEQKNVNINNSKSIKNWVCLIIIQHLGKHTIYHLQYLKYLSKKGEKYERFQIYKNKIK